MSFRVNVELELSEDTVAGVLTSAVEGYIVDWLDITYINRYPFEDGHIGHGWVTSVEGTTADTGERVKVDLGQLARAIEKILNGEIRVNDRILDELQRTVYNDDACYADAETADVAVQAAAFGEVVYG